MGKPEDHVSEIKLSLMLPSPPYMSLVENVQSPLFKPWKKPEEGEGEPSSNPWEQPFSQEGSQLSMHSLWLQNETKVLKHKQYPNDKRSYRSLQPMKEGV